MFYKILSNKSTQGKLFIPNKFFLGHNLTNVDSINISAGKRTQEAKVVLDSKLNEDELMVSQDILNSLLIPVDIKYQINCLKGEIRLGPVIGLLMVRNKDHLTRKALKELSYYTHIYSEINGLLLAMNKDGIDFDKQLVKGYYYAPSGSKDRGWKAGVFPIPDSIFQRESLPEPIRLKLKKITNNRMFNSRYFNKWEFYKVLSKFSSIREHIPDTRPLLSIGDIDYMLSRYDSAYLKPVNGTLSRGLYKVTKVNDTYVFQGKYGTDTIKIPIKNKAENFIKDITKGQRYIIQQAIRPLMIKGRHTDFRVIMQKDHTLNWICTGIISFIGRLGDICSNWGGQATFEDLFIRYLDFSQAELFKIKQEIIASCRNVCEVLDSMGENYGDLGFDVVVDESFKVWILEANKKHYHTTPLWINDYQTFYAVKANPIKYAAGLSGFKVY